MYGIDRPTNQRAALCRGTWGWRFAGLLSLAAGWAVFAAPAIPARGAAVTLIEKGQARSVLVLSEKAFRATVPPETRRRRREPADPKGDERRAAEEIRWHLEEMTGVRLEIVPAGQVPQGLIPIRIGSAADAALDSQVRKRGDDPASFVLKASGGRLSLRGLAPAGTLNAAYELLEQLGVRWFLPGRLGLVIPKTDTVRVAEQTTVQTPSFGARHLQAVDAPAWQRRMRLGGPYFPSAHGVPGFGPRESERLFADHAEYFSLVRGKRTTRQLCVSNPGVLRIAVEATKAYFRQHPEAEIMGIGANDGRGFCECEDCRALDGGDFDPFGNAPSMTDRYVWFFNQVLKGIEGEFPNKRLGFYAYSVYNRPPVRVVPDRRLVPAVALITLCRFHGMDNPVCPEKSYEQWIIQRWGERVPEVYYRGYWYNLADPGLPYFFIERVRRDIPLGKDLGVAGWRVETPADWAASAPSRYVACKLMWDHTADVDRLMQDFYERFFGPARGPMRRYIETMSHALTTADFHTGSSWDMPHIYTPEVRAKARAALGEAVRAATGPVYGKRVWMYQRSFDYLEAFIGMLQARARHDYVASKEALDRMHRIRQELADHSPPLIGRHAESYLRRFFSRVTEAGYQRTTNGNELIVGLDDTWQFQIDPAGVGEAIGWWRPETSGGNWQRIRTSTASWSDQGLRYYKGLAWYRQKVEIPARYAGRRIFLWIGGVDEQAKVWLNGKLLGTSPKGCFVPFEFDATEAARTGGPNTVVVGVTNVVLNELGTGGITGPVMFYAPKEPGRR